MLRGMLVQANQARREPVPLKHLTVGLRCGGSDGYSGISANPVLGAAVDLLVQQGGTAILSETPEIYGAEHLLTHRAASPAVADKLLQRLAWWEGYAAVHGGDLNNNPSPGNKAGSITTILEKSLGAVAKAGRTGLMDVLEYAEPVRAHGLVFMDTPGYDPVSATGQVLAVQISSVLPPGAAPHVWLQTHALAQAGLNTPMFTRMSLDMDDCGGVVDGRQTIQAGAALLRLMVANGLGPAQQE